MRGLSPALLLLSLLAALSTNAYAVPAKLRKLKISENGRFLVQQEGRPFFYLSDAAYLLFEKTTRKDADLYLRDRAARGFTVIMAVLSDCMSEDSSGLDRNAYGAAPYVGWCGGRPNPAYFRYVDWVLARGARYGLRFALMPVWGGCEIGGPWCPPERRKYNKENALAYGQWLGRRYKNAGIIWLLGGDTLPRWPNHIVYKDGKIDPTASDWKLVDYTPVYDAMAMGLEQGEGPGSLLSFHPACCSYESKDPLSSVYLNSAKWLSIYMIQSSHFTDTAKAMSETGFKRMWNAEQNYKPVSHEYGSIPVHPVIDAESSWEENPKNLDTKSGIRFDAYDSRHAAYESVFSGAAGYGYGNANVNSFFDPLRNTNHDALEDRDWHDALSSPGASQMQFVKGLMLSRPYLDRIPDQSIIVGDVGNGSDHVVATRDRRGRYAMVYLPTGEPVKIDLGRLATPGGHNWWFDPRTGHVQDAKMKIESRSVALFTPPTHGSESDWVLVIDSAGEKFTRPGNVTSQ